MIYVEPNAGVSPIEHIIESAQHEVLLNVYYINDAQLLVAIKSDTVRGVKVYVIVAGNPYGMRAGSVEGEESALASVGAEVRVAPSAFEGQDGHYSYDHAKYLVTDQSAVIETANLDASAFGRNREYIYTSSDPALMKALSTIFLADFSGQVAPDISTIDPNLVVSPGSEAQIQAAISQPGPIEVEVEELGDNRSLLRALENKGSLAEVIIPPDGAKARVLSELAAAGVQVREMHGLYMHAKIIVGGQYAFLGSQNFSSTSLLYNREIGILTSDRDDLNALNSTFNTDWMSSD